MLGEGGWGEEEGGWEGGRVIGEEKAEAESLEGDAIMEGWLKVRKRMSSALLFMDWKIELW